MGSRYLAYHLRFSKNRNSISALMAAIPATHARQSVPQYIRSFLSALPRLRALVGEIERWEKTRFRPRADLDPRIDRIERQLFAAMIPYVQLMTSLRSMRRVMAHHCVTYGFSTDACATARLAQEIEARNDPSSYRHLLISTANSHPEDARMGYARALQADDEGDAEAAARAYAAIAALPNPGAYASLHAAAHARSPEEAKRVYRDAADLYPNFSLAQRALGAALRARAPLEAADCYARALEHGPQLEYGEQSWVIASRSSVEVEIHRGFRIFYSIETGRNIACSTLLGMPKEGVTRRTQGFRRRFLGLALMRFHKDKIWRRARQVVRPGAGTVDRTASVARPGSLPADTLGPAWFVVAPLRRWAVGHYRYFQFVLVGRDSAEVRAQIDRIREVWMRDGALQERMP